MYPLRKIKSFFNPRFTYVSGPGIETWTIDEIYLREKKIFNDIPLFDSAKFMTSFVSLGRKHPPERSKTKYFRLLFKKPCGLVTIGNPAKTYAQENTGKSNPTFSGFQPKLTEIILIIKKPLEKS